MKRIAIKAYETYHEPEILALYKSVGWSAYYDKPELLREAFSKSLCIYAAYDTDKLVGLIRTVGDGATVVFVQDILVNPCYQRQGIGRMLIGEVLNRYHKVRQLHLMTDDTPETVRFYKAVGFTVPEDIHCRAFTRLHYQ